MPEVDQVAAQRVQVEVSDHLATVTLSRPEKHNALDRAMFEAIVAAAERVAATSSVRAVVLRLVVVLGFFEPEEVVAMDFCCSGFAVCREIIEHVFVHDRLARVTTRGMKRS